jgi:hypothetical protein
MPMDDIVKQAMSKWPNVPHCYGWLGLDARGNWYLRDDQAQALGGFGSGMAAAKGSRLEHAKLIDFIQRNYAVDEAGQWYFQNGPQRVYIELAATPWVWRVADDFSLTAHDGSPAIWRKSWTDEQGWLYCETSIGFGLVHTQDVGKAAEAIEHRLWSVTETTLAELSKHYRYATSPQRIQQKKKQAQ